MATAGGLIIRTQDGSTYFIRDEILEACKVADEELAVTEAMVEESDDVAGFSLNFATPVQYQNTMAVGGRFNAQANQAAINLKQFNPGDGTVMCCW